MLLTHFQRVALYNAAALSNARPIQAPREGLAPGQSKGGKGSRLVWSLYVGKREERTYVCSKDQPKDWSPG